MGGYIENEVLPIKLMMISYFEYFHVILDQQNIIVFNCY